MVRGSLGGAGGGLGGDGGDGGDGGEGTYSVHGECLQVSLESFLQLEEEDHATRVDEGAPADETVQIAHKLLLDLLNLALRQEAVNAHRMHAPICGSVSGGAGSGAGGGVGGAGSALPMGCWYELPESEALLQRLVDAAVQQTLRWLVQANAGDGLPIEVQLSCLLDQDASDVERGWQEMAACKEQLLAESSDLILAKLIGECAEDLTGVLGVDGGARI